MSITKGGDCSDLDATVHNDALVDQPSVVRQPSREAEVKGHVLWGAAAPGGLNEEEVAVKSARWGWSDRRNNR